MNNLSRGERLQIMLSPEELSAVDDFRFKQRMPSRAAAVRELFRLGLRNAGLTLVKNGKKRQTSVCWRTASKAAESAKHPQAT